MFVSFSCVITNYHCVYFVEWGT